MKYRPENKLIHRDPPISFAPGVLHCHCLPSDWSGRTQIFQYRPSISPRDFIFNFRLSIDDRNKRTRFGFWIYLPVTRSSGKHSKSLVLLSSSSSACSLHPHPPTPSLRNRSKWAAAAAVRRPRTCESFPSILVCVDDVYLSNETCSYFSVICNK